MKILLGFAVFKFLVLIALVVLGLMGIRTGLARYIYVAADAVDADRVIGYLWNASWVAGWREQHSAVPRHRPITRKRKRRARLWK